MPLFGSAWLGGFTVTYWFRRFFTGLAFQSSRGDRLAQRGLLHVVRCKSTQASANALTMSRHQRSLKPPNILLYTDTNNTGDEKYNQLRGCLSKILDKDSYALYRLKECHVVTQPWADNTALLVVAGCLELSSSTSQAFMNYLKQGGKVLSLCSGFHAELGKTPSDGQQSGLVAMETTVGTFDQVSSADLICEPFFYEYSALGKKAPEVLVTSKESGRAVIIKVDEGMGTAVLSMVHLEEEVTHSGEQAHKFNVMRHQLLTTILEQLGINCSSAEDPQLTPAYLFASQMDQSQLMTSLQPVLKAGMCKGRELSLKFVTGEETPPQATKDILPVIIDGPASPSGTVTFDWQKYLAHLNTNVLGKILLYSAVITSTQAVFDGNYSFVGRIPTAAGVVVVAGQQMKGKGRGGNAWLSPVGCLMFSLQVRVSFDTELGSRLPYLQHIASLAVVEAVRTLPGYEEINLCLKWPNDIYLGRTAKIGGVIVTSSASDGSFSAVIGMGINLSNSKPTGCINDAIQCYNEAHGTDLQPLCEEVLLARTVNYTEALIEDFQVSGPDSFQEKYYKRWLHSNSQVCLNTSSRPEWVTITGLDNFGFLLVQTKSGEMCSVQPDGNSFDMLKNLITTKQT